MPDFDDRASDSEPYTTVPKSAKGYQIRGSGGFTYVNTNDSIEPEFLSKNDIYSRSLFAARLPVPSYREILKNSFRSAQVTKMANGEEAALLQDPYSNYVKAHIEDAYRKDATVRRGIDLYVKFLLGKRTNTVIDVNREFMDLDLQEQVLADTFNEAEVHKTKTFIDRVNRQVKFHQAIYAGVTQALLSGRAALTVETGPDDIPVALKILNWRKLGKVYADPETWQLLAVDYADRKKEDPIRAEEMLYLPHADYHISPNTLYYGLSKVEPILDVSHTNRIINQEDLKEGARIAWSKNGIVKFLPNTPLGKMREFIDHFRPGWHATTQNVTIEEHDINVDLTGLSKVREENDKVIQRGLTVPSFLMGYEEIPNKATAETTIHAWRESELNYARTWLQDLLEVQWFDSLLKIRYPDLDLNKMWIKAKLEFEDITFESLLDKSQALVPLYQQGILPLEKVLKVLDMEDVIPQVQAMQQLERERRRQELEMMRLEQQKQQEQDLGGEQQSQQENAQQDQADNDERPRRRSPARQGAIMSLPQPEEEPKKEEEKPPAVAVDNDLKTAIEEIKQAANLRQASIQDEQMRMQREEHEYKMQMLHKINEKLEKLSDTAS